MLYLRPILPSDNAAVARIIRTVMPEFNCVGEGYSINDPELEDMHTAYSQPRSGFFVLVDDTRNDEVVGVGGYAPLAGSDGTVCELRKMYLLSQTRGKGGGRLLMDRCITDARRDGYARMYLETVASMTSAAAVYEKYGFTPLPGPLGSTGHSGCDRFMIKSFR
ncbi:putative acetyltransferase [Lewinella aquimaris]|uniref:Putative acetyltransferase n=1 Tax=Neolewinella aquimaris TaxID=1835722 RepID=A0A840EG11_9BACT|nr:GNAT family N-acetyltransferase [Neolewinella aquimaris]MBB4079856.1 putative acetyltransferase [Neolewinella aquimaris]